MQPWVWLGDAKGLAMAAHNRAVSDRISEDEAATPPQKKSLYACQFDAVALHSLILGLGILHDHGTQEASDAAHAIIATARTRASALADDLDELFIEGVRHEQR